MTDKTEESSRDSVELTKVVLYKHGIGYFERRGKVTGPGTVELVCGPSEIDDMLKSLVALTGSGRIDAITYDSAKTLESRLAEFGFDLAKTRGLVGLLGQMKGIPVTLSVSGERISGRVLGLDESEQIINERVAKEQLLTLYTTESNFRRIPLASISAIHVDDEAMAAEMNQQLELLFQNAKKKDRKSLKVALSEAGEHELFIAYSIPCPIWKTSYRLVMTGDSGDSILLQGMAIVDNVQEEDWNDVNVVLVSSSPISFIQPLYDPVQPYRATIASQGVRSAGPVVAERAQRKRTTGSVLLGTLGGAEPAPESWDEVACAAMPAAAPGRYGELGGGGAPPGAPPPGLADRMAASFADELAVEAVESGEHFEYRIQNRVTIPRNSSALIPIVQQTIEGERISLYNESKNKKFPFAAVRLKNTTGLTLEAGPATIMEAETYAGEALLDTVKPGDVRYLLYANDQSCPVVTRVEQINEPYWRVRCGSGLMFLDYRSRNGKTYQLDNLSERKKLVIIEHPITQGWKLKTPEKSDETTESYYRFRIELDPQQSRDFSVWEETDAQVRISLAVEMVDAKTINWLFQQNFTNKGFLDHLKKVMAKNEELRTTRYELVLLNNQSAELAKDQQRARENLKTLGSNNERYRRALDTAEDQIQENQKKFGELQHKLKIQENEFQELCTAAIVSELEQTAG